MSLFVDDKKVGGIKELCEALKIDPKSIPYGKRTKEFVQEMQHDHLGNPSRDLNGNYVTKRKIAGVPQYSIFVPKLGYEVRVRMAQTQRKEKDDFVYSPKIVTMDPGEDGVSQINDEQEFAFWYLHPWNGTSPFHQSNAPVYFRYKDNEASSKIENDFEEAKINALGYIIGNYAKTTKQLRSIAKGLNFVGVDDMSDEFLKKQLRAKALENPIEFVNKVESREIIFSGQVQDAIDKGILATQNLNGMLRWYLNGKEILPIAYGMDSLAVLKEELSSKWYLYSDEIQRSLNGTTVADNLSNAANDEHFHEDMVHEVEQLAEVTPEMQALLKEFEVNYQYAEKIKKLAAIDPEQPGLHAGTKRSYENNKEAVELYKASLLVSEPV